MSVKWIPLGFLVNEGKGVTGSLGSEVGFTSDEAPSIKEMGSEIAFTSNETPSIKEIGVEIGFTSS